MIKMKDKNVIAGLMRTYSDMNPCQYVREIYQNSVEAGATDIRFGVDKAALESLGIERGISIDNGPGIPKNKILELINNKNSSSKKVGGAEDNFGVGLKVSALPRNQYGLIVMCRTEDRPQGFMIWLAFDVDEDGDLSAGVKGLTSDENWQAMQDENAEEYIDHVIDFEEIKDRFYDSYTIDGIDWLNWWDKNSKNKTGTAVILCGNLQEDGSFENTLDHLILDGRNYLQSRYLTYSVPPIFQTPASHYRILANPLDILIKTSKTTLTMNCKSWKIHVFINNGFTSIRQSREVTPLIHKKFKEVILYKNELYGDYNTLSNQSIAAVRNSWGIWSKKVGNLVTLIIEPPAFSKESPIGVYPNEARSKLSWKDSIDSAPKQTLPLDELKDFFKKNMPAEIQELLDEQAIEELSNIKKSKEAEELNKWLKIPREKRQIRKGQGLMIPSLQGSLKAGDKIDDLFGNLKNQLDDKSCENNSIQKAGQKKELTKEELKEREEKRKAREAAEAKRQEAPIVKFITQKHIDAEDRFKINGIWQAAYYQPPSASGEQGNVLWINQDHDCLWGYINICQDWLKQRGKTMNNKAVLEHIVKPFWETYAPCAVQQAKSIPSIKQEKDAFAPERLTWLFYGSMHFFQPLIKKYYKTFERISHIA